MGQTRILMLSLVMSNASCGNISISRFGAHQLTRFRWRVAFMEKSIALLDFETVDQMVQIHGMSSNLMVSVPAMTCLVRLDYEGVSLSSRTESSKKAASEASKIFQDHYPEFLVCLLPFLDFLALADFWYIYSPANFLSMYPHSSLGSSGFSNPFSLLPPSLR